MAIGISWGDAERLYGADTARVGVIVSMRLKPYLSAVKGIQDFLENETPYVFQMETFFFDDERDPDNQALTENLKKQKLEILVAVGPEAMFYVWHTFPEKRTKKIFSMVLNPEKIISDDPVCGITLNIPISRQLFEFHRRFPQLRRIGIVFDPSQNRHFVEQASVSAASFDLKIVPIEVNSRQGIMPALRTHWRQIDALWMIPDRTVITESLIAYIIKDAIANNTPVYGYNRYFTKSGAAVAIACNYERIGHQTGRQIVGQWLDQPCERQSPIYDVIINADVLRTLNLSQNVREETPGEGRQ